MRVGCAADAICLLVIQYFKYVCPYECMEIRRKIRGYALFIRDENTDCRRKFRGVCVIYPERFISPTFLFRRFFIWSAPQAETLSFLHAF